MSNGNHKHVMDVIKLGISNPQFPDIQCIRKVAVQLGYGA
jgi:hypothetical protein